MPIKSITTRIFFTFSVLSILSTITFSQGVFTTIENPAISDQKAGSVLVFPYYDSDMNGDFNKNDTILTITNVANGPSRILGSPNYSFLHLFFINGANCSPADTFLCLTPNGSIQILASAYDPAIRGYLIVVAVDESGAPTQNNNFIGSAYIRDNNRGIIDSYGAEAFQRLSNNPAAVDNSGNAWLSFDGVEYEAAPKQFSIPIIDPTVSDQSIVLVSISGDLGTQLEPTGQNNVGAIYRADERPASFPPKFSGCQIISEVTSINYRVVPGTLNSFLKDSYGYIKFNVATPAVGLYIAKQGSSGDSKNRWSGIRTLHKTAVGTSTFKIPMFPTFCSY